MIGDLGTQTSRFGYAGDDCPKAVFPSAVGHVVGGEKSSKGKKLPPLADAEASNRSTEGWPTHVMGDANLGRRRTDLDVRAYGTVCVGARSCMDQTNSITDHP